jgi:hypothetical protein
MARDWTPVRKGSIYCSPACGARCTYKDFQLANRKAEALLARMKTGGWKADVWENMGWHYALRHDTLEISLHGSGGLIGRPMYFLCGLTSLVGDVPHMKDPNKLVSRFMTHLKRMSNSYLRAIDILERKPNGRKKSSAKAA